MDSTTNFGSIGAQIIEFQVDETSLVRNPLSGWALYDDANDAVANGSVYWAAQDSAARKYASIFYFRSRWSELESEEGNYAWENNENFKALIKGALDRGLKLAFCIYIDGQDNISNATPDFVRAAGAKGYPVSWLGDTNGEKTNWTPYVDDPIFQEKFANFIRAFAREFDDPSRVDFVDGSNLGWWGEGHNIGYINKNNNVLVYNWITKLYGENFKRVILVTPFGTDIGFETEKQFAINQQDYIFRRNGLGSQWFMSSEIENIKSVFPTTAFIAEGCYWKSSSDTYKPWLGDAVYGNKFNTWVDYYNQVYKDAINSRANVLDLREAVETNGWVARANNLVLDFIKNGGYRFTPVRVELPETIHANSYISIVHTWKNSGNGVCPNNNERWNYKYKVAFAFVDSLNNIQQLMVDEYAEPSEWLKETDKTYYLERQVFLKPGAYSVRVAVVDTSNDNKPGLSLAVKKGSFDQGWLKVAKITVK